MPERKRRIKIVILHFLLFIVNTLLIELKFSTFVFANYCINFLYQ